MPHRVYFKSNSSHAFVVFFGPHSISDYFFSVVSVDVSAFLYFLVTYALYLIVWIPS